MDMEWLRNQMSLHGISQRELAGAIGMTEQMFTNVVQGRRMFKSNEVDAIRRHFGFTLPEDMPVSIAVVGRVAAGDHVHLFDDQEKGHGLYQIARPPWVPLSDVAAAEVSGSSAEPWALNGDIIFWQRKATAVFEHDLGRAVIAETAEGKIVLKRLASGTKPDTWSLLSINPTHPNMIDVRLKWAARVLPPLPRDEIRVISA